jgi:hypothetical protein
VALEARPTRQRGSLGTGGTASKSGRAVMRRWWRAGQRLAAAATRVAGADAYGTERGKG